MHDPFIVSISNACVNPLKLSGQQVTAMHLLSTPTTHPAPTDDHQSSPSILKLGNRLLHSLYVSSSFRFHSIFVDDEMT
jgi:hypothetical protein